MTILRPRVAHAPSAARTARTAAARPAAPALAAVRPGGRAALRLAVEPLLVGLEPVPGDVRRQPVADQHQALLRPADQLAGGRPPRLLPPRVDRPVAEPVGPGVARVVQQVLQRRPVRPPPLQLAPGSGRRLGRTGMRIPWWTR